MSYQAENIDTEKALEYLRDMSSESNTKEYYEKLQIEKYYEGYRKGIEVAKSMFYCSNYEKSKKE